MSIIHLAMDPVSIHTETIDTRSPSDPYNVYLISSNLIKQQIECDFAEMPLSIFQSTIHLEDSN